MDSFFSFLTLRTELQCNAMQAAAANSAAAGMEAATAKKMMADFRAAITAQVATLEQRLGVDAAQLTQVNIIGSLLPHVNVLKYTRKAYARGSQSGTAKVVMPNVCYVKEAVS